jgi:hypothetical protein
LLKAKGSFRLRLQDDIKKTAVIKKPIIVAEKNSKRIFLCHHPAVSNFNFCVIIKPIWQIIKKKILMFLPKPIFVISE